jgi:hypothetical protein
MQETTMDATIAFQRPDVRFVLRFQPLREDRAPMTFPCDEAGHVDLDTLGERGKLGYYFAHTLIGRDFRRPCVQRVLH